MFKCLLETLGSHHAAVGMLALLLVSRMSMIIHLLSMKTYLVSYSIILTSHCTCVSYCVSNVLCREVAIWFSYAYCNHVVPPPSLSLSVVFNLPENTSTPINSTVGSINATDLDGDPLTYSIEEVMAGSPQFVAVNEGEVVRFTGPQLLDYESSIK